ncbi:MAG: type II toxin-antitoxin system VapC family toxin [Deltaproteobacteria bacterium]|nr:type II toxin-antitoxin system VapC family toxin [Deltaproteobacteria bacterium]
MYVFDTDVLSLLMKGKLAPRARARLAAVPADRAKTTTITLGELYYGAMRSAATTRWLEAIMRVEASLPRLGFDDAAARCYGEIRAHLESKGRRLDDADLRIAAICIATDHTLVSGNEAHFARVPRLRYENWLR